MMQFRIVKNAVVSLLDDYSDGRFRVIGRQRQSKASDEIKDNDRLVQVYYAKGSFNRSIGKEIGDKSHDITIHIDMSASAAAQGDISVLDNPLSTATQKAAAIAAIKEASEVADEKIDELIEMVFQILMDARHKELRLGPGEFSNRWIPTIQKDTNLERGDLVVKTANIQYDCNAMEPVTGAVGVQPRTVIFNSETPVDGGSSTGVTVENDNT